jgi:hypothetical protein
MIAKGVLTMLLLKKLILAAALVLLLVGCRVGRGGDAKGGSGRRAIVQAKQQPANVQMAVRPAVEGKVVDADGKPLAGAQVYLADPYHPVTFMGRSRQEQHGLKRPVMRGRRDTTTSRPINCHHHRRPGQVSF